MSVRPRRSVSAGLALCVATLLLGSGASADVTQSVQSTPAPASYSLYPAGIRNGPDYEQYNKTYWTQGQRWLPQYLQLQLDRDRQTHQAYVDQALYGKIILALVVVIVIVGLLLSILQFVKGLLILPSYARAAAAAAAVAPEDQSQPTQDSLKIDMSGIELKSASLGVLILAMSLAFFFLYLKFVYTITVSPG